MCGMRKARIALLLPLSSLFLFPGSAVADQLPDRAERVVSYAIDVRLDAERKQLEGRQTVTWRNPSTDPVGDLWFHLYLNAFRNNRSTFFRESGGQLRGDRATGKWGWIDVTSLRLAGGADLTRALTFEQRDDGNADDRTVARLVLPEPVPPGGSVTLEIDFRAQLPEVFARSGYKRDFYLVGQWFPKLGVYEPMGMRGRATGGWNCHQYHANSEFYANYGEYRVTITVPSRFVVGATGHRTRRRDNGNGTTTHTYEQADVHDFAWTADPRYIEVKRRFSASGDVTAAEYQQAASLLGRPPDAVRLSNVAITVLLQPEHEPQLERYVQAVKAGLKGFGLRYGRYPYQTITVVDPPADGSGAGGMEYPTFITGGSMWAGNFAPLNAVRSVEMVTIHEFGHQFWYGMVGNNEFEEAWLDEGINTYSTGLVMEAEYGAAKAYGRLLGLPIGELDLLRGIATPSMKDVIVKPSWMYAGDYGYYAYMKPAIALRTLEGYLGSQVMARVMRTFHERFRFRHPSSADFFATASEVAGQDLDWFFRQAFLGSDVLDYAVDAVSSSPVTELRGVVEEGGKRGTRDAGPPGSSQVAKTYESRVLVRRLGEFVFPVEVALQFEGKLVERVRWDGKDRWKRFVFVRSERLVSATIDPDHKVVLDANWIDNSRRVEPDGRLAASWGARFLFAAQVLLTLVGM
jgi:hypothetical protein